MSRYRFHTLDVITDTAFGGNPLAVVLDADDLSGERMQTIANDLADLSDEVFVPDSPGTRALRRMLLRVGHLEGRLARNRTGLLGIDRAAVFICERKPDWMGKAALHRLHAASGDLEALNQFDGQLTDKLQFLQDAVLGFINTDQNEVMKLLTVVSVATVPPITGVYGYLTWRSNGRLPAKPQTLMSTQLMPSFPWTGPSRHTRTLRCPASCPAGLPSRCGSA